MDFFIISNRTDLFVFIYYLCPYSYQNQIITSLTLSI